MDKTTTIVLVVAVAAVAGFALYQSKKTQGVAAPEIRALPAVAAASRPNSGRRASTVAKLGTSAVKAASSLASGGGWRDAVRAFV
jgi:hypothetical protein